MPAVMTRKKYTPREDMFPEDRLPQFKLRQSSPFVPSHKVGMTSRWEEHFQLIQSKQFKLLKSETLTDKQWGSICFVTKNGRGIDHERSLKRLKAFRTAVRNRFNTQATMLKNGFGIYCVIHPDDKGKYILRVAKIAFTEAEVGKMFREGGRGKGRIKQVLQIRTFAK